MAKRAESKQRIKEALDKFIRYFFEVAELTNEPEEDVLPEQSRNTALSSQITDDSKTESNPTWEDKA